MTGEGHRSCPPPFGPVAKGLPSVVPAMKSSEDFDASRLKEFHGWAWNLERLVDSLGGKRCGKQSLQILSSRIWIWMRFRWFFRNSLWEYHLRRSRQSVFYASILKKLAADSQIVVLANLLTWKVGIVAHVWCCQKGGPREQAFAEPCSNPSECVKMWSEGITFGPTGLVTLRTRLRSNLHLNCRSRHWNAAAILPVLPIAAKHIQIVLRYWYLLNISQYHQPPFLL